MYGKINEFFYFINAKTGNNIIIKPEEYEIYKNDIEEMLSLENKSNNSVMDDNYFYETVNISLNVTSTCNLMCKYCFNKAKKNKKLSYQNSITFINKIISLTPNAHKYVVDMSGSGEPLLELPTLIKIADYCYNKSNEIKKHIMPQFVCNGTLLTNDIAQQLMKANILFGVSLDGNKKQHNKSRILKNGDGTFEIIMNNIKKIKPRDYIGASVTITNDNMDILKIVKFLSKHFKTIAVKIVRTKESLNWNKINNEYEKLALYIINEAKKGNIKILKSILNGDDFFGKYIFRIFTNSSTDIRCDAGIGKYSLDTDLNIYTCSAAVGISKLTLGTLEDFNDTSIGKRIQNNSVENKKCYECNYKKICGGECLVNLYYKKNSNDMCNIKKHLIKLGLYLKGKFIYSFPHLYEQLLNFCKEINLRFYADTELEKLSHNTNLYTYMQLKWLKDNNIEEYNNVKNEILN